MRATLGRLVVLSFMLLVLQSAMADDVHHAKGVSFLPLTISIACGGDTPVEHQTQYARATGARPEVTPMECVDKTKVIDNVFPSTAAVGYSEQFRIWLVAVTLNDKDALAARKLSAENVGGLMVISVDHKALSISQLGAPLRDNKIYINADSKNDAHNLMMRLTKP